jgi:hypothetical protein
LQNNFDHSWILWSTPNSPKMTAIFGEFGGYRRIQSPNT